MSTGENEITDAGSPGEGQATNSFVVMGQGSAVVHRDRHARRFSHSEYQPTGLLILAQEEIQINVSGFVLHNLFAVIGVPKLNTPQVIPLTLGQNRIQAVEAGILSFINLNPTGFITVSVQSIGSRVPTFKLGETTNDDWFHQMRENTSAPVVLLTSARAIVVVRYQAALASLTDPLTLMGNFDQFIGFQDAVSGVGDPALEDCRIDPNKLLFLEGDDGFMTATEGYMWFNGAWALECLLSTDPNNSWGPWHEAGHQRQLTPMTWGLGTAMREVTVNLYALAVQEALDGRASRLDEYDAVIKAYLSQPYRDYNLMKDAFHKVVMLWQLRTTFGPGYYPQLHQLYRLMPDPPLREAEKAQRFMIETSLLAGVDLTPFYDRWGLHATTSTLIRLEHLPALAQPIWETDATHTFPLPIPQPNYIPVLAYLKSNVVMAGISDELIQIFVRGGWLEKYRYEIFVNGLAVASIDNGVGQNCTVLQDRQDFFILVPHSLAPKGKVEMCVVLDTVWHRLFVSGRFHSALKSRVDALFTDRTQTEIVPSLTQSTLDVLFADLKLQAVDDSLFNAFHRAQMLRLRATVNYIAVSAMVISVFLVGDGYYEYDYELEVHGRRLASLDKGVPTFSTRIGNVWSWRGLHGQEVRVNVIMHGGHRYRLLASSVEEDSVAEPVRSLFTDDAMTALRPAIGQGRVDSLRRSVSGNFVLSRKNRAMLIEYLSVAQRLLLRPSIDRVVAGPAGVSVYFSSDAFKTGFYLVHKNGAYASQLDEGRPYYSSLTQRHWKTSVPLTDQDTWEVVQILGGYTYTLYSSSDEDMVLARLAAGSEAVITDCGDSALPANS
jgi:hypothetical protein